MELLRFTVRNQKLSGGKVKIVSDSIDYVEASFDFRTEDWEGLSKWAHFMKDDTIYDINLVEDKITRDMHLNLEAGEWEVKLHGTDSDGTMRITTGTAYVVIESYGNLSGEMPLPEIPLSATEQIDAKSQKALENSEKAIEIANEGATSAGEAIDIANAIKEAAERGDFNGEKGDIGITPNIQIGNVETLKPGENAAASIGGTPERPILNLGLPKGDKGDMGTTAYESAVLGGYDGTEEEFYKHLNYSGEMLDEIAKDIEAIEKDIADLKYFPIEILSFTNDAGTKENGDEVWNLMLSYSLNKAAEDLILDGESRGSTEGNTTGWIISQSGGAQGEPIATATRTYTLEAVDERGTTAKKTTTINFYDGIYYGCTEEPAAVDSAFILSLTKKLSGGK
ncbi:MAG: hypothetical protein IKK14_01005, partial [Oscillospiraceae bacterium]|nr:hypothetical protein [Oscillospiraceae bacterium]